MRLLLKKQLYDAFHKKLLYLALFFIILVGMVFYSGFVSAQNNIQASINKFYEKTNLADYTIKTTTTFDENELEEFKNKINGKYDLLYTSTGQTSVNTIYYRNTFNVNKYDLVKGTNPQTENDIILDYEYAVENDYDIDQYIIINNKAYYITGLAKFPNHIFKGNYFPDKKTFYVALQIKDPIQYNTIFLDSDISEDELNQLIKECFSDNFISVTAKYNDFGYKRVESDLKLVNSILFIFPLACFISIIIILFINYNKIIDDQKPYIGILKSNGFSLLKIYFSLLILPIILVIISSIIGALLGANTIPKFYTNFIANFYAIPKITEKNIFISIILPIILLTITTIITISIPIIICIKKEPALLIKSTSQSNFGRSFLRKVKLPYHFKLIVRNIITAKRKNICMILASSLLLGIVLSVYFVNDSVNYTDKTMAIEAYNGDCLLDLKDNGTLFNEDSVIEDSYFYYSFTIKIDNKKTFEDIVIYENEKPCIKLKNYKGDSIDGKKMGIYVPSSLRDEGYEIGDEITLYHQFDNYTIGTRIPIANFIQEMGGLKFAISLESALDYNKDLHNAIMKAKNLLPKLVKLKDGKTIKDLETYIKNNYTFEAKIEEFKDDLAEFKYDLYKANFSTSKKYSFDLKDYNVDKSFSTATAKCIVLNDKLDILNINVMSNLYVDKFNGDKFKETGIYLPHKYKDYVNENNGKFKMYLKKNIYEFDVAGYIDSDSIYSTYKYFLSKGLNEDHFKFQSYITFTSTEKIPELKEKLEAEIDFSSYKINTFTTFGTRLGIINDVLSFTKKLASFLASVIFILLIYNIGVIGLNNRVKDISIFKSAGLNNKKLKRMLNMENNLVVLLASIISIPISILFTNSILKKIYAISSVKIYLSINALSIIIIIIFSLILMNITSFFINKKIQKMNLANLMKGIN